MTKRYRPTTVEERDTRDALIKSLVGDFDAVCDRHSFRIADKYTLINELLDCLTDSEDDISAGRDSVEIDDFLKMKGVVTVKVIDGSVNRNVAFSLGYEKVDRGLGVGLVFKIHKIGRGHLIPFNFKLA